MLQRKCYTTNPQLAGEPERESGYFYTTQMMSSRHPIFHSAGATAFCDPCGGQLLYSVSQLKLDDHLQGCHILEKSWIFCAALENPLVLFISPGKHLNGFSVLRLDRTVKLLYTH